MLHLTQLAQFLEHLLLPPSFLRQRRKALYTGTRRDELALKVEDRGVDLRSDFRRDTREAEECAVEESARRVEELCERCEGAVAAEVDEGFAGPAEEEEDEEDVTESVG
jgi:hypothetical protein